MALGKDREEPPLRGSRCSLNDDSAEIGSDADGELDDYNLDPGKFNEEGSFIDQYATETHYKGASRLPTLPRV
ncbi:putative immunoglobulin domain superfamily (Sensory guidance protein) [Fasciolopsis buskii]|uniref:Putative immunoglobulin domain superfamily (Sensory guidance protein) n=1 Tax=Fasciolopsis buskii TaxID=27845 RepID=A0A8E0VNI7_9TREM|nr:putative immunoglobulin domain superfamily (Sensory guidance protein) [Fasciolopsis buski]